MIVANSESATDMERSQLSSGEYSTVQRTAVVTYAHAQALQARATCAQRWRCGASPPRPVPTPTAALQPPNLVDGQRPGTQLVADEEVKNASLSELYLGEGVRCKVVNKSRTQMEEGSVSGSDGS